MASFLDYDNNGTVVSLFREGESASSAKMAWSFVSSGVPERTSFMARLLGGGERARHLGFMVRADLAWLGLAGLGWAGLGWA